MAWWGKLVGGTLGFVLGGPLGAAFGAAVGHSVDRGVALDHDALGGAASSQEHIQASFFGATFAVMGHLAKADGRVSEDEIALANSVMRQMSLTPDQARVARELFNQGKRGDFDLEGVLAQFRATCRRRTTLLRMFLEIQVHAAWADGAIHPRESELLHHLAQNLGFGAAELEHLIKLVQNQGPAGASGEAGGARSRMSAAQAREVLGVSVDADAAEIKKAYRRLMSQHHPDKLVSKGLPEEMMALATERAQEIRAAYDRLKDSG